MLNLRDLKEFLVQAKKATYASGNESLENKEVDGSTSLIFENGDFKYHDNYFGGEPYGGREVVFYKNKPVYMMVYYGQVDAGVSDLSLIYSFLRKALLLIPEDYPYRGPQEFREGGYIYINECLGGVDGFSGKECIEREGETVYEARYAGGLVAQR